MADVTVKVIAPAENFDLLTLEEAKLMLGIAAGDTSQDAQLALQISMASENIAQRCNRYGVPPTFGKQEVQETWREIGNGRLFLTHWPVKLDELTSVQAAGTVLTADQFELEEQSGKVSNVKVGGAASANWTAPVIVHYSGGYTLPTEAPLPLKYAAVLMISEERSRAQQASVAGIRQLSHKEARVVFFDPNAAQRQGSSGTSAVQQSIESLLKNYMRFEV